jgi:enoyl-CoA hydratase/carnithine racemase
MFSAGLDVPHLVTLDRGGIETVFAELFGLLEQLARSPVPVVAALTGHSPAGGAIMALYCDYRVMAQGDFRIGLNEVEVGLPLPRMVAQALARLVGAHRAAVLLPRAEQVDAARALEIGWVDELVAPERVVERALEWCRESLAMPRNAMLQTRSLARADLIETFHDVSGAQRVLVDAWFTDETQNALRTLVARLAAGRG